MKPSEAWEKPLTLDDPKMEFFATVGERKLVASMLKTAVEDIVMLRRYNAGQLTLPRGTKPEELAESEAWVREDRGAMITFSECVEVINPDFDRAELRRAILVDPEGALDRIRHAASFVQADETDDADLAVIDSTEEEIAEGMPPITVGRLSFSLLNMLQSGPEQDDAGATDRAELGDGHSMRMAA